MKKIRISTQGCPADYHSSLLISTIKSSGYSIAYVKPSRADLIIYGSFYKQKNRCRWIPKFLRTELTYTQNYLEKQLLSRKNPPLTLFHTAENLRHNHLPTDYSISSDIVDNSETHIRLPYWMEMVDWSHEGVIGNQNPRYGSLLSIHRLMQPLGNDFIKRDKLVAFFTSHLREPRKTILNILEKKIEIDKYGPYFSKEIKNHHSSKFLKKDILQHYSFNLCPENSLYPGYVTEKIPESFHSGCLPISWTDSNVNIDFNEDAFINLAPMTKNLYEPFLNLIKNINNFSSYADQPLIKSKPSILQFYLYINKILEKATS